MKRPSGQLEVGDLPGDRLRHFFFRVRVSMWSWFLGQMKIWSFFLQGLYRSGYVSRNLLSILFTQLLDVYFTEVPLSSQGNKGWIAHFNLIPERLKTSLKCLSCIRTVLKCQYALFGFMELSITARCGTSANVSVTTEERESVPLHRPISSIHCVTVCLL